MIISRILSSAQPGAEIASLEFAIEVGLERGGVCPAGTTFGEGGSLEQFGLTSARNRSHIAAIRQNVAASDATLAITTGRRLYANLAKTRNVARDMNKPFFWISEADLAPAEFVIPFLLNSQARVLHVTGALEEAEPGIHAFALAILRQTLAASPTA